MITCAAEIGESHKLWRLLQTSIKALLSGWSLTRLQMIREGSALCDESVGMGLELPHSSRYLLLASFLASNNPAASDKKFFSNVSE